MHELIKKTKVFGLGASLEQQKEVIGLGRQAEKEQPVMTFGDALKAREKYLERRLQEVSSEGVYFVCYDNETGDTLNRDKFDGHVILEHVDEPLKYPSIIACKDIVCEFTDDEYRVDIIGQGQFYSMRLQQIRECLKAWKEQQASK